MLHQGSIHRIADWRVGWWNRCGNPRGGACIIALVLWNSQAVWQGTITIVCEMLRVLFSTAVAWAPI